MAAFWGVGLFVAAMGLSWGGCTTSFEESTKTCTTDADCPSGQGCAENLGLCLKECVTYEDCPNLGYRCEGELCFEVMDPECTAHENCDEPAACEASEGAICLEGQCDYQALSCDDPPARECVENDTILRVYSSSGSCDPDSGGCVYEYTDIPCAECSINCLENDPCEDVTCPDQNGGCRTNGVCLPTDPPTCQYENAPVNTACDRAGSPEGSLDGFCNEGICGDKVEVTCTDNGECSPETCLGGYCGPRSDLQGTCDSGDDDDCASGLVCHEGVCLKPDGGTCSTNGECVHTCISGSCAPLSSANGACDAASGGDDDDCSPGLFCNNGVCETSPSCNENSECSGGDTCIGGYCRAQAATGGTCDPGDDADCVSGHSCVSGVCLLDNGSPCGANGECVNVCISGTCSNKSGTGGDCDYLEDADCVSGHDCTTLGCQLVDGQTGCTADSDCVHTCIAGTCGPRVGTGETCDSQDDCIGGHGCSGGRCLLEDGETCGANDECLEVCISNFCTSPSSPLGACDTADGDADCDGDGQCTGGICYLPNGSSCSSNSHCVETCISGTCAPYATTQGYCDTADDDDCEPNHACISSECLLHPGQSCLNNDECTDACVNGVCSNGLGNAGEPCDEHSDCDTGLPCVGDTCRENGLWYINVDGGFSGGGGGLNLSGWRLTDDQGNYLSDRSSGPGQCLYHDIDWTAELTSRITGGQYFVLEGDEDSSDTSRTFTFYDGFDSVIDSCLIGPVSTNWIVREFTSTRDYWIRFHYNGTSVSCRQQYAPISKILVEGTATGSGGGSGLAGYHEVNPDGDDLGSLSLGTSQNLYQISS